MKKVDVVKFIRYNEKEVELHPPFWTRRVIRATRDVSI